MKIKPLGDRVLLKHIKEERQQNGIIIPDSAKTKENWFKVIAVGEDSPVETGDIILMSPYRGQEIEVDGESAWIYKNDEILAVKVADMAVS